MNNYEFSHQRGVETPAVNYVPVQSHSPSQLGSQEGPYAAPKEETQGNPTMGSQRHTAREYIVDWHSLWWWWEICALIIAIGATVGLVVYLKIIDNKPLREWFPSIQPNSVLAILTTVQKATLMAPVASSISQLKWHHFTSGRGAQRLEDLQLFDGASRGPWGSLMFLLQVPTHTRAIVAAGFALLTILALGIDPSAQQLLYFPIQQTEISDEAITMGTANAYISTSTNALAQQDALNPHIIPLQFEIMNSLRGATFENFYTCPQKATRCSWDNITTFGVCSTWNHNTSVASSGCDILTHSAPRNSTFASCNYTLSNTQSGNPLLADAANPYTGILTYRIPSKEHDSGNTVFTSLFHPGPYVMNTEFGEFVAWRASQRPSATNFTSVEDFVAPNAEMFFGSFFWCSRTFSKITVTSASGSGSGSGQKITYGSSSSERLRLVSITNVSSSRLYSYEGVTNKGLKYSLEDGTYEGLTSYLTSLLDSSSEDILLSLANGKTLDTGTLLYQQPDLSNATSSIADTLTNVLRSTSLGENFNATDVAGRGWFDETYIRVRWIWILPPVAETGLVVILFVVTVVATVSRRTPLLKESVLAYLATTTRDNDDDDGTGGGNERTNLLRLTPGTSHAELTDLAADMVVKLQPDQQGNLIFFREHF